MKKLLAFLLALALIPVSMSLVAPAAQASNSLTEQTDDPLARYVSTGNTGKLNVRSAPKTNTDNLIAQLDNGTRVVIIEYLQNNTWVKVEFPHNGRIAVGYVQNRYLTSTNPAAAVKPAGNTASTSEALNFKNFKHVQPTTMCVKPSTPGGYVNLRWAPSKSVSVMTKLYADAAVIMIAKDSTWAQVYDPTTGYVGFMMLSFLKK